MLDAEYPRTTYDAAWHVGEILSLVMGHDVAPRGPAAIETLRRHLVGDRTSDAQREELIDHMIRDWITAHIPAMGSFTDADRPCRELLSAWLSHRVAQFGAYLRLPSIPSDMIATYIAAADDSNG